MIIENSTRIILPYMNGTWKIVCTKMYENRKIFFIEREQPGFLITAMVVDEEGKPVKLE